MVSAILELNVIDQYAHFVIPIGAIKIGKFPPTFPSKMFWVHPASLRLNINTQLKYV